VLVVEAALVAFALFVAEFADEVVVFVDVNGEVFLDLDVVGFDEAFLEVVPLHRLDLGHLHRSDRPVELISKICQHFLLKDYCAPYDYNVIII
jgi:hypothetical protein